MPCFATDVNLPNSKVKEVIKNLANGDVEVMSLLASFFSDENINKTLDYIKSELIRRNIKLNNVKVEDINKDNLDVINKNTLNSIIRNYYTNEVRSINDYIAQRWLETLDGFPTTELKNKARLHTASLIIDLYQDSKTTKIDRKELANFIVTKVKKNLDSVINDIINLLKVENNQEYEKVIEKINTITNEYNELLGKINSLKTDYKRTKSEDVKKEIIETDKKFKEIARKLRSYNFTIVDTYGNNGQKAYKQLYVTLLTNKEEWITNAIRTSDASRLDKEFNKDLIDSTNDDIDDVESEEDNNKKDSDDLNKEYERMQGGQIKSNFTDLIGSEIKIYLASLKQLSSTNTIEGYNYDTNNALGVPENIGYQRVIGHIISNASFNSVIDFITSLENASKKSPHLYYLQKLVNDCKSNNVFANKLFHELSLPVIEKNIIIIENSNIKNNISNIDSSAQATLLYSFTNQIRFTYADAYGIEQINELENWILKVHNNNYDKNKLNLYVNSILNKYIPNIELKSIDLFLNRAEIKDIEVLLNNIKSIINISKDSINEDKNIEIEYNNALQDYKDKLKEKITDLTKPTRRQNLSKTKFNKPLITITNLLLPYSNIKTSYNHRNAENKMGSDMINNSYISNFIKQIEYGTESDANLGLRNLLDFVKDKPQYKYSPIFWGVYQEVINNDGTVTTIEIAPGLFKKDNNGYSINPKAKSLFKVDLAQGVRDNETKESALYDTMSAADYFITSFINFHKGINRKNIISDEIDVADFFLRTPSDAPKNYTLSMPKYKREHVHIGFKQQLLNELNTFASALNAIYNFENEEAIIRKDTKGLFGNYHFKKTIFDKNGRLTGNVFQFVKLFETNGFNTNEKMVNALYLYGDTNISLIGKDGKLNLNNPYFHIVTSETGTNKIELNVDKALDVILDNIVENWINNYKVEIAARSSEFSSITKELKINYEDIENFILNSTIANINFDDIFEGSGKFYKDAQTFLKRAKEVQAGGKSYAGYNLGEPLCQPLKQISTETIDIHGHKINIMNGFKAVTINNTVRPIHNAQAIKLEIQRSLEKTLPKSTAERIAIQAAIGYGYTNKNNPEAVETTVNDAQSYITIDELIARTYQDGSYNEYKELFDKLLDPNVELKDIDFNKLHARIQVQKNFYFDHQYDADTQTVYPRQIKNAEFVLIPKLLPENSSLRKLYDTMIANGIGQVNTAETDKASKRIVLNYWDNNGVVTEEAEKQFDEDLKDANNVETYYYRYLYKQQAVVDHMKNQQNKAGIQIMKKFIDNYHTSSQAVKNNIDRMLNNYVGNIQSSFIMFIDRMGWTTNENGVIVNKFNGSSQLDFKEFYRRGREEAQRLGLDSNFYDYLNSEDGISTIMPNFMNVYATKLESIANAMFNRSITRQTLPGWHAAQITNVGYDSELKYHPVVDGKQESYCEVRLPLWFVQEKTNLSKEEILERIKNGGIDLHIGYRIPTEGKQSISILKVVDVLSDAYGSTVVVSDAWVTQTGSDFDIDTVYGISFEFYEDKNGNFHKYKFIDEEHWTEKDDRDAYNRYVKERIEEKVKVEYDKTNDDKEFAKLKENINKANSDYNTYDSFDIAVAEMKHEVNKVTGEVSNVIKNILKSDKSYYNKLKDIVTQLEVAKLTSSAVHKDQINIALDRVNEVINIIDANKLISKAFNDFNSFKENAAKRKEEAIKAYNDNIDQFAADNNLMSFEQFSSLPVMVKNRKEARNNEILDSMIKILEDETSSFENYSRSNFDDISTDKNEIDKLRENSNNIRNNNVIQYNNNYVRSEVENDKNSLYIFTDNTDRDSGKNLINPNSKYAKKYGSNKHYPTQTQAVIRGLDNAMPISTQKYYHDGAKGEKGRWNDSDAIEFEKIIVQEINDIINEWNTGKYNRIVFGKEDGLFNTKISNISETRTPKLYEILQREYNRLLNNINTKENNTNITTTRKQSVYNPFDQIDFMGNSTSVMQLKAMSVNRDSNNSIQNKLQSRLHKNHAVKVVYDLTSQIKVNEENTVNRYNINTIKSAYGGELSTKDKTITVTHDRWANSNNNLNVVGKLITVYSSETTAHILDAIKTGAIYNENKYTFTVFKTLVDLGVDYYTAIAFLQQPAISRIVKVYNESNSVYLHDNLNIINTSIKRISEELGFSYYNKVKKVNTTDTTFVSMFDIWRKIQLNQELQNSFKKLFGASITKDYFESHNVTLNQKQLIERFNYATNLKNEINNKYDAAAIDIYLTLAFAKLRKTSKTIEDIASCLSSDKFGAKQSIAATRIIKEKIEKLYDNGTLTTDNTPVLQAVYPGFKEGNIDVEASKYKSLAAFLKYSTLSSININKQVFDLEKDNFIKAIRILENRLGRTINEEETNKFKQYFVNYVYNNIESINTNYTVNEYGWFTPYINDGKALSHDEERRRIIGLDVTQDNDFEIKDINNISQEELDKFIALTPVQKVQFMQRILKDRGIFEFIDVYDINGRSYLRYNDSQGDIENIYNNFRIAFFGKNNLARLACLDLIKYAFVVDGYRFKKGGISKIIPNDVLLADRIHKGLNFVDDIKTTFYSMLTEREIDNAEFIDRFIRANSDITSNIFISKENTKSFNGAVTNEGLFYGDSISYQEFLHLDNNNDVFYRNIIIDKVPTLWKFKYINDGYNIIGYKLNTLEENETTKYSYNNDNNKYIASEYYEAIINDIDNQTYDFITEILENLEQYNNLKTVPVSKDRKTTDKTKQNALVALSENSNNTTKKAATNFIKEISDFISNPVEVGNNYILIHNDNYDINQLVGKAFTKQTITVDGEKHTVIISKANPRDIKTLLTAYQNRANLTDTQRNNLNEAYRKLDTPNKNLFNKMKNYGYVPVNMNIYRVSEVKENTTITDDSNNVIKHDYEADMTFDYGNEKRNDIISKSTIEAIKNGERTATTRYKYLNFWSKMKIGDIVKFKGKNGEVAYVRIIKELTKLDENTNPEEWSKKEGWSIEHFNRKVKPLIEQGTAYQIEYEYINDTTSNTESTDIDDGSVEKNAITNIIEEVDINIEHPFDSIDTSAKNIINDIYTTHSRNRSQETKNFVDSMKAIGLETYNTDSIHDNQTDIIKEAATYYSELANILYQDSINFEVDGKTYNISDPELYREVINYPDRYKALVKLILDLNNFGKRIESILNLNFTGQDPELDANIKKIQDTIKFIRDNVKLSEAINNVFNEYIASNYSNNPLVRLGLVNIRESFADTDWWDSTFSSIMELNNNQVQTVVKYINTVINNAEMFTAPELVNKFNSDFARIENSSSETINWDNIVDKDGYINKGFIDDFRTDKYKLFEEVKKLRNEEGPASLNYLNAKLARDKWLAENTEQPLVVDYYNAMNINLEDALIDCPDELSEYLGLIEELKSISNDIEELSTDELIRRKDLINKISLFTSKFDENGNEHSKDKQFKLNALKNYIKTKKELNKKYFVQHTTQEIQEKINRYSDYVKKVKETLPNSTNEQLCANDPEYKKAYEWLAYNTIHKLNDETQEKISKLLERAKFEENNIRRKVNKILQGKDVYDKYGRLDIRKISIEDLAAIKELYVTEQTKEYEEFGYEDSFIKEVAGLRQIGTKEYYERMASLLGDNEKSPIDKQYIARANTLLAVGFRNNRFDSQYLFEHLSLEELKELANIMDIFNSQESGIDMDTTIALKELSSRKYNTKAYNRELAYANRELAGTEKYDLWKSIFSTYNHKGEEVPNPLLFGYSKINTEYLDVDRTEYDKFMSVNVERRGTEEFNEAINNPSITPEKFRLAHIYNKSTHKMEPLSIFTEIHIKETSSLNGEYVYNPAFEHYESEAKDTYKNDNYSPDDYDNYNYSARYSNGTYLNNKEKEIIKLFKNTLTSMATTRNQRIRAREGFMPRRFIPNKDATWYARQAAATLGVEWKNQNDKRWEDDISYTEEDEVSLPMLQIIKQKGYIDPSTIRRKDYATSEEYYDKLKEVKKHNLELEKPVRDNNWKEIMQEYIKVAAVFNAKQDVKNTATLLLEDLKANPAYKVNWRGEVKIDTSKSTSHNTQYKKVEHIKTVELVETWYRRVFREEYKKPHKLNSISSMLQNMTSAKYMIFNVTGGIANVGTGMANVISEALADEYFSNDELKAALKQYTASSKDYIGNLYSEKSNKLTNAVIKLFNIVDFSAMSELKPGENVSEYIRRFRNSLYSLQSGGEHFMQNTVLLAMMKSNRLIKTSEGKYKILDFNEYTNTLSEDVILDMFKDNDELRIQYKMFLKDIKEDKNRLFKYVTFQKDYNADFFRMIGDKNLTNEYIKRRDKAIKDAKTEFNNEANRTVESLFELKDGMAVLKTDITNDAKELKDIKMQIANFRNKTFSVNQKIHGVYDKIGAAQIEKYWYGNLVMQYHKHLYPGIMKRWRVRGMFNEQRGTKERGNYVALNNFLFMDLDKALKTAKDDADGNAAKLALKASQNIIKQVVDNVVNIQLNYRLLSPWEQHNLHRCLMDNITALSCLFMAIAIHAITDDDELKDSNTWSTGIYICDRLTSEAQAFLPWGAYSEAKTLYSSPLAASNLITDTLKLCEYTARGLFDANFNPTYTTGLYKGEDKRKVYLLRNIPAVRVARRLQLMSRNNQYYRLNDNIMNILPAKAIADYIAPDD